MADRVLKEQYMEGKPGPYCHSCPYKSQPLVEGRRDSPTTNGYMIVGQGPSEADAKSKKILSGISGFRLKKQSSYAGFILDECWLDGVVKCVVPKTRKPTKTAMRCCRPMLEETIRKEKPHTVITLGAPAFEAFYPGGKLMEYHGAKITGDSYTLIPMFMPNAQDDNPDLMRAIAADYSGLKARRPLTQATGDYRIVRQWPKIVNDRFAIDSETTGLDLRSRILSASISQELGVAVNIAANDLPRGLKVRDTATMHNAKYDLGIFDSNGIVAIDDWAEVDCSMLLAYCMCRKPLTLKALSIQELQVEMKHFGDVAEDDTLEGVDIEDYNDYACADADILLMLWDDLWRKATPDERNLYTKIERPIVKTMAKMQLNGVLVDVPYFERLSVDMDKRLADEAAKILARHGLPLDVMTSPTKLAKWLSEKLGRKIGATGKFDMDKLKGVPAVDDLMEWRPMYKLKTSFIDSILRLQKLGLVYPTFNQTGTLTGRMSGSGPNLQQLPKRTDKTIRKGFIAPIGQLVLSLDNSQIDLRSLAYLSKDEELNRIFDNDLDAHDETALKIKGNIDELARRMAKTANFLTVFGGGSAALAMKTDIEQSVADEFMESYWDVHPGVKAWIEATHKFLRDNSYVETAYKRRRYIPAIYTNMAKSAERMGQNMPVQGTSADILKLQMAAVSAVCVPWAQIHDELLFYVPERGAREMAWELKKLMEGVDAPFRLKCEAALGPSLGEVSKVEF